MNTKELKDGDTMRRVYHTPKGWIELRGGVWYLIDTGGDRHIARYDRDLDKFISLGDEVSLGYMSAQASLIVIDPENCQVLGRMLPPSEV